MSISSPSKQLQQILHHQNKTDFSDFNILEHASFLKEASGSGRQVVDEILLSLKSNINSCLKVAKSATGASGSVLKFDAGPRARVKLWISLKMLETVFVKSRTFREAIIDSPILSLILDLALSLLVTGQHHLPLPNSQELKILDLVTSILVIWTAQNFTSAHPKLIVFNDRVKKSDIVEKANDIKKRVQSADEHVSAASASRMEKSNQIRLNKYLGMVNEWADYKSNITEHQTQLESLLEIVYPPGDDDLFGAPLDETDAIPQVSKDTIHPPSFTITINLKDTRTPITENSDNSVIFDQIREHRRVLIGLQGKVHDWLTLTTKVTDNDTQRYQTFLRDLIDVKARTQEVLEKSRTLLDEAVEEEESDEEEFEEVDESFKVTLPEVNRKGKQVDNSKVVPVYSFTGLKPVFASTSTPALSVQQSGGDFENRVVKKNKNPLFDEAPIVEWQPDLDHWSSKTVTFADISTHAGLEFKHRFLGESTEASHDKVVGSAVIDRLRKRVIVVEDTQKTVEEYPICGVKLKNGKGLCQRRDMQKCPFHGIIQSRDQHGELIDPTPADRKKGAAWEEIEQDILIDNPLGTGPSRRRGRGRMGLDSESLTTKSKESARARLERKSKRISSRAAQSGIADGSKHVNELIARDKSVFKW